MFNFPLYVFVEKTEVMHDIIDGVGCMSYRQDMMDKSLVLHAGSDDSLPACATQGTTHIRVIRTLVYIQYIHLYVTAHHTT